VSPSSQDTRRRYLVSTDAQSLTALGRLISEVQSANRWSYADIASNATAAGRKLSKSRVESLRNDPLPSISVKAIEALAAGLRVAPNRVAQAAMESMGYALATESLDATQALAGDPALSDPMRRVLTAALTAAHRESESVAPRARRGGRRDADAFQRTAADDGA
jgi:hypothetical protein